MNFSNNSNLPTWLVDAITYSDYPIHEEGTIGVTTLIDSPRIRMLREKFPDIEIDVCSRTNLMFGSAVHKYIEAHSSANTKEMRIGCDINGMTVSGQIDVVDDETIYDIKTTKATAAAYGIKNSWIRQLNVYRWLLKQEYNIKVVAFYKDWSIGDMTRMQRNDYVYPSQPIEILNMPVWDMDKTRAYIIGRIDEHSCGFIPACSPEERWQLDGRYAVHSGKTYKAKRVVSTIAEAYAWCSQRDVVPSHKIYDDRTLDEYGYYIVKRPEVWNRCKHYCDVSSVCSQYKEYLAGKVIGKSR